MPNSSVSSEEEIEQVEESGSSESVESADSEGEEKPIDHVGVILEFASQCAWESRSALDRARQEITLAIADQNSEWLDRVRNDEREILDRILTGIARASFDKSQDKECEAPKLYLAASRWCIAAVEKGLSESQRSEFVALIR